MPSLTNRYGLFWLVVAIMFGCLTIVGYVLAIIKAIKDRRLLKKLQKEQDFEVLTMRRSSIIPTDLFDYRFRFFKEFKKDTPDSKLKVDRKHSQRRKSSGFQEGTHHSKMNGNVKHGQHEDNVATERVKKDVVTPELYNLDSQLKNASNNACVGTETKSDIEDSEFDSIFPYDGGHVLGKCILKKSWRICRV